VWHDNATTAAGGNAQFLADKKRPYSRRRSTYATLVVAVEKKWQKDAVDGAR
jgi:hypothetical protein